MLKQLTEVSIIKEKLSILLGQLDAQTLVLSGGSNCECSLVPRVSHSFSFEGNVETVVVT